MVKPIKRELAIFLVVGLLTVGIDFLSYHGFLNLQPFGNDSINIAKGFGFVVGIIFAYFANRFWTFNQQVTSPSSAYRFVIVYIVGLLANIGINHLSIGCFSSPAIALNITFLIAFILATGFSATLNFLGMKLFVFTDR